MQSNSITSIDNLALSRTPKLKSIFLTSNNISGGLPILAHKELHLLDVSKNKLTHLLLTEHPNITELNLSSNLIEEIPILGMPKLRKLDISSNKITNTENIK